MEDIDFMVSCTTVACTPGRTPLPLSPPKPFGSGNGGGVELDFGRASFERDEVSQPLARPLNAPYGKASLSEEARNTLAEVDHIQAILKGGLERLERSCSVPPPPPPQYDHEEVVNLKKQLQAALCEKAKMQEERDALRDAAHKAQHALTDAVSALQIGFRSKAPPPPLRHINLTSTGRSVSPPPRIPTEHQPRKIFRKPDHEKRAPLSRVDPNTKGSAASRSASKPVTFKVRNDDPYKHNSNESVVHVTRTVVPGSLRTATTAPPKLRPREKKAIRVVPVSKPTILRSHSGGSAVRRKRSVSAGARSRLVTL